MHIFIEAARKAAGISGLKKNYPDDPKQRGCGYWASFIGSLETNLGHLEGELRKALIETKDLAKEKEKLRGELDKIKDLSVTNGMETIGLQEGWSPDKRAQAVKKLISN